MTTLFPWKTATADEKCAEFVRLDRKFGTVNPSPLHHDNRCPIHRTDPKHRKAS